MQMITALYRDYLLMKNKTVITIITTILMPACAAWQRVAIGQGLRYQYIALFACF